MNILMFGPNGSGKGTQGALIKKAFGLAHIESGAIFREHVGGGTELGKKAKEYMDHGQLVPDDVIIGIINDRLQEEDCKNGFILDGVPRTIGQAEALEKAGIHFDAVIDLEISDEEILQRMSGRRVCEKCGASYHIVAIPPKQEGVCDACGGALVQRADDAPETVRSRLEVYHSQTEPLKEYYAKKGNLKEVENQPTVDGTTAKILAVLGREA